MSGDRAASVALYAAMVLLSLMALIARRPPLGQTVKMAAGWAVIFAVGLLLVSQRDRFAGLTSLFNDQRVVGTETRIRMAEDGHFWADASIDGARRRMLIDSGATTTAISIDTARAAHLDLDELPFPTILATANGPVSARTATVASLKLGTITAHDLGVVVSPAFGDTDVIGMNLLSKLSGWRVEGNVLILTPTKP